MLPVPVTKNKQLITSYIGAHYYTLTENNSEKMSNNPEPGQQKSKT
jgi:YHS domain-containing protein